MNQALPQIHKQPKSINMYIIRSYGRCLKVYCCEAGGGPWGTPIEVFYYCMGHGTYQALLGIGLVGWLHI